MGRLFPGIPVGERHSDGVKIPNFVSHDFSFVVCHISIIVYGRDTLGQFCELFVNIRTGIAPSECVPKFWFAIAVDSTNNEFFATSKVLSIWAVNEAKSVKTRCRFLSFDDDVFHSVDPLIESVFRHAAD